MKYEQILEAQEEKARAEAEHEEEHDEEEHEDEEEQEEEEEQEHGHHHGDEEDHEAIDICRRTSDHRLTYPTCNTVHEIPLVESQIQYLGYVCSIMCG
jgi:hypothetical protein